jgi:hypothetical protein
MRRFGARCLRSSLCFTVAAFLALPSATVAALNRGSAPPPLPGSPVAGAQGFGGTVDAGTGKVSCPGPDQVNCTYYDMSGQP